MDSNPKHQLIFDLVILLFFGFIIVSSFSLRAETAQVPFILSLVAFILTLINIAQKIKLISAGYEPSGEAPPYRRVAQVVACLVALAIGFKVFGMIIAGFVFCFVFAKYWGGKIVSYRATIIACAVYICIIYVVFAVLMKFPLYKGILNLI